MAAALTRNAADDAVWPPRLVVQLLVDVRAHASDLWPLGVTVQDLPPVPAHAPPTGSAPYQSAPRPAPSDSAPASTTKPEQAAPWGTGTRIAAAPTQTQAFAASGLDLSIPEAPAAHSAEAVLAQRGSGEPLLFDGLLDSLRGVPVDDLDGVSAKVRDRLIAGSVGTVYDLLMRVPLRYVDRTQLVLLRQLRSGMSQVTFIARVLSATTSWEKRYVRFQLGDDYTRVSAMFFNAMWMGKRFRRGDLLLVQGDVGDFNGALQMTSPLLEPMTESTAPLLAIYPQSQKHEVDTWMLRRAAVDALRRLPVLDDPIPGTLLAKRKLPSRLAALRAVHVPESKKHAELGRDRLSYDELLRLQLALGVLRNAQAAEAGVAHKPTGRLLNAWLAGLPYTPTGAQQRAISEIRVDMTAPRPMNRLLQGDVGAGKTLVLSGTALMAIEGGY